MDVLTEALRSLRTRNQIFGRLELTAPWGIRVENPPQLLFYAVSRGAAMLETKSGRRLSLVAGDIALLRAGLSHTLKDHWRSRAAPVDEVYAQRGGRCGGLVSYGGGGAPAAIIAGGFSFETTPVDPVMQLPEVLYVEGEAAGAARWLESTLHFMALEMQAEAPGFQLVASRLADVLFVHALRSHMVSAPVEAAGWLHALADPQLGIAMQRIHERPADPWTVEELARATAMSRSGFAARFKTLLGVAPLTYLTRWRMHRATELLGSSSMTIADVAGAVGYETESAFTRVFKRHTGATPGAWRRRLRAART